MAKTFDMIDSPEFQEVQKAMLASELAMCMNLRAVIMALKDSWLTKGLTEKIEDVLSLQMSLTDKFLQVENLPDYYDPEQLLHAARRQAFVITNGKSEDRIKEIVETEFSE